MYIFNPTLKNINNDLFSKELGFDDMRNVYRMRLLYYHMYGQIGVNYKTMLFGLSKYKFFYDTSIKYTYKDEDYYIKKLCNGKTLMINNKNVVKINTIKQEIAQNKLYDIYTDNSTTSFIIPEFGNTMYDTVIIHTTYANIIEFKTDHLGLLNLYYFHINFVYVHNIFKILKIGGSLIMWFIPVHIKACAELTAFLFDHFENVKYISFEFREYVYLQKFKGYDKNKWDKLMDYWYNFDQQYGINYTHNEKNNIILKELNIIYAKPITSDHNIFFDKVFDGEVDYSKVIEINKTITKNQIKRFKYMFKCEQDINYLCKKYYTTYDKFYNICNKRNIKLNPAFMKYDIRELINSRVLKQYIFTSKKFLLIYDILNNIYNTDNDILYILQSMSANMNYYNICFYNLKKKDIKYIIPTFKIFGDIEINIYNDKLQKRLQCIFRKYCSFNPLDKNYDIIVCRYNDYTHVEKYAKNIIFLENIIKYKPNIRYDTYNTLSYTQVGYMSSTKIKYQIYRCFTDNNSQKKLFVLLKKIIRFTDIDKLKKIIKPTTNDYDVYDFLHKHYKPQDNKKSSGYMYAQYINELIKDNKIETFLDFGAGNGVKTEAVKNVLKLKNSNVYAIDKNIFESVDNTKYKYDFTYIYYDGISYPQFAIKFDLITCIQVLHHIFEIDHTLKYIKSILKKGGILIIKEHLIDDNKNTSLLIDIEHSLYELVPNKNKQFLNTYYARYFTEIEFIRLMVINGFIYIPLPEQIFDDNNPTNYIYYMFTH